jgi:lipopolysaccharide transport system ATP-binding protein
MSSELALSVERLGKRYALGANRERYKTLRDSVRDFFLAPFRRRQPPEPFWALKDVSFEVPRGEVLGIIGRNGAGKSTLLKILSSVTEPTEGEIRVWGSVGALLEVGTGFHPELTGRENIYLNGAILGMKRHEIRKKFDEIVAFAEISKFLDTPAKRYSSGMYMRLAFSVAAHMNPDILLIDEVLAVGDANFQKKCLGKMEEVSRSGRTVLFVSHSMPTVLRLCRRAILLEHGKYSEAGTASEVVAAYLQAGTGSSAERVWPDYDSAPGDSVARLHAIRVKNENGEVSDSFDIRRPIQIEVEYWHHAPPGLRTSANLHFYNDEGVCLFITNEFNSPQWATGRRKQGLVKSVVTIPGNFLAEGRIIIRDAAITSLNPTVVHAHERDPVAFQVIDQSEGDGVRGPYVNEYPGVMRPMLRWDLYDLDGGASPT